MKLIVAALTALALPAAAQTTICTAIAEAATGKVVKQEGNCDSCASRPRASRCRAAA